MASATRTNNWADYGGMDVYVKQINGSANHDFFYTDPNVNVRAISIACAMHTDAGHVIRLLSRTTSRPSSVAT